MADDKEKTLTFINDYRMCQMLWDVNHKYYRNQTKRNQAIAYIGQKHNYDITMVKNKIKSLRSYFCREYNKVQKCKEDNSVDHQSPWFAYNALSFISDTMTVRDTEPWNKEPEENSTEDQCQEDVIQYENTDLIAATLSDNDDECNLPTAVKRKIKTEEEEQDTHTYYESENVTDPLRCVSEPITANDEYATFGQLVTHKLRKLNPRNKLLAERRIIDILFDMETEEMNSRVSSRVDKTAQSSVP